MAIDFITRFVTKDAAFAFVLVAALGCGEDPSGDGAGGGGDHGPACSTGGMTTATNGSGGEASGGASIGGNGQGGATTPDPFLTQADARLERGREIFRAETFGDEAFWTGQLRLDEAIEGADNGGVGPGVSPNTALALGLKVDMEALPADLVTQIQGGQVDLDDPKSTLALLKLNSVVGVHGTFASDGSLSAVGIQCALCHSTVDDAFAPGIGHRLDGWPNRTLNVGAIIAAAPDLSVIASLLGVDEATVRTVLNSWGPGKFDAELILDGKAFRPDNTSAATLIPAAFAQSGQNLHTYEGWGSTTYWNAFVANLEMHGQGTFFDPRLDDASRFPIAAANGFGHTRSDNDLITDKLGDLHLYQLALEVPAPPATHFDAQAAGRGADVFNGKAQCSTCHVPPLFTEPGWNMHTAQEIGIDDFQAQRSPDARYATTSLRGLFVRETGGFYHDGRFPTYAAVIDHYDNFFQLGLTAGEKSDLAEYLKSL